MQRQANVLAIANRLGREGWRLASLDVAPRLQSMSANCPCCSNARWPESASVTTARQRIQDHVLLDPAKLRVLGDPIRSFVVYSLVPVAKTVKQLAEEPGCPPTRLYYHMQQLEKHALVFVERERRVSGIVEKHYRAVGREMTLDRASFLRSRKLDRSRRVALLGFVFDQSRRPVLRARRCPVSQRPATARVCGPGRSDGTHQGWQGVANSTQSVKLP